MVRRLFRSITLLLAVPLFAVAIVPQFGLSAEEDCDPKFLAQASALTSGTDSEEIDIKPEPSTMLDPSSAGLGEPDAALLALQEPLVSVTVKTYIHVINKGEGLLNGDLPEENIQLQMDVLNNAFASTPFQFELVQITRTTNEAWFNVVAGSAEERDMKTALHEGDSQTLNIYTARSTAWFTDEDGERKLGLASWGFFPWWYRSDPIMDGVVNLWFAFPGLGLDPNSEAIGDEGIAPFNNEGDMVVHEVGHWLGLLHTFQNGCDGVGDEVADTPAHLKPAGIKLLEDAEEVLADSGIETPDINEDSDRICGDLESGFDTCPAPGTDPNHNYMNYTSDQCMNEFTIGQDKRMQQSWSAYRVLTKAKGRPAGKGKPN